MNLQTSTLIKSLLMLIGSALAAHGFTKAASWFNAEDTVGLVMAILGWVFAHLGSTENSIIDKANTVKLNQMSRQSTGPSSQKYGLFLLLMLFTLCFYILAGTASAQTYTPSVVITNANGTTTTYYTQTTTTNVPVVLPVVGGVALNGLVGDLEAGAIDIYNDAVTAEPYAITNQTATFRFGGGINTSSKHIVLAGVLTVPMTNNISLGVIVAHIGSEWLEGGCNLSYGVTKAYPVIGMATIAAGDGVVYDFISRAPANYIFTDVYKEWTINPQWKIGGGVTAGNTSDRPGVDLLVGLHVTCHWGAYLASSGS